MITEGRPILQARNLRKLFPVGGRMLFAVDGVNLDILAGQTLALVVESGSGKSTVGRCLVRLIEPTSGEVFLDGRSIIGLNSVLLSKQYRRVQMVFQDPNASLNPRMTVRQTLIEPLKLHLKMSRKAREDRARELVEMVGLTSTHLNRYPNELSGGQRQRIGIARAIAVEPDVVILDEPTSSLDVSVRGQILDLLIDLQEKLKLAYLFISHDLQVVRHVSHRVAVMYLGGIVEIGPTAKVFQDPKHPYTRALLSAAPVAKWGAKRTRLRLSGEISSPIDLPDTCRLVGRCPFQQPVCSTARPPLVEIDADHAVACPIVTARTDATPLVEVLAAVPAARAAGQSATLTQ
jgi:oligopeptide/dipeptide ABC transporter ATP-binding protein